MIPGLGNRQPKTRLLSESSMLSKLMGAPQKSWGGTKPSQTIILRWFHQRSTSPACKLPGVCCPNWFLKKLIWTGVVGNLRRIDNPPGPVKQSCKADCQSAAGCQPAPQEDAESPYSSRRAFIGSSRAARRAGSRLASIATHASSVTASPTVKGSPGFSP